MARVILDVRNPGEFAAGHASKAKNLPLPQLGERIAKMASREDEIWVCCETGGRSSQAAQKLRALGYQKVKDLGSWKNL